MFGLNKQQEQPQREGKLCLMNTNFKRLPKHLYYVGTNAQGTLCLMQTRMQVGSKARKKEVPTQPQEQNAQQPTQEVAAEFIPHEVQ